MIPWEPAALRLPAEDAASLPPAGDSRGGRVKVAAPVLSRLANYDDADPLRLEPDVEFAFVPAGRSRVAPTWCCCSAPSRRSAIWRS